MEIAQEDKNGKPCLPLFFELEDANQVSCKCLYWYRISFRLSNASPNDTKQQQAVSQAVEMDGGKVEDFEVVGLDLPQAVSLLANENETAFQFIPPSSSLQHIRGYLSG